MAAKKSGLSSSFFASGWMNLCVGLTCAFNSCVHVKVPLFHCLSQQLYTLKAPGKGPVEDSRVLILVSFPHHSAGMRCGERVLKVLGVVTTHHDCEVVLLATMDGAAAAAASLVNLGFFLT